MTIPNIALRKLIQLLPSLRNRHFLLFDLVAFSITPAVALYLRIDDFARWQHYANALILYTVSALLTRTLIFYYYGLYRRYWRFISGLDLAQIGAAVAIATGVITLEYLVLRWALPLFTLPRSVLLIDAMLCFIGASGIRASIRITEALHARRPSSRRTTAFGNKVVIVGAGYTGALLVREMHTNRLSKLDPILFLDDDVTKHGMQLHGIPVVGDRYQLPQILRDQRIERVLIAMPTASGQVIREIVQMCRAVGVVAQTMPGLHELLDGTVSFNRLRNVQIEDLLRRTPIQTDTKAVRAQLQGKRVLVTGGGGSIGSELCRQILHCQPTQLILLGHGENSIFEVTNELNRLRLERQGSQAQSDASTTIIPVIADLRFRERMDAIFTEYQPQVVFHAAAHKHVPLMEANPVEAITNNVLSAQILLETARKYQVERFVMISTDKAVNPTNVMGASKRIAELLVLQAARSSGQFYQVVRFGNVLGSRGSVIHTFKQQIAAGGPITVTHPEMVRYFMTIPEAVQLVLQASVVGRGGEVLMLDMGDPVRIVDLAKDLIELSGLQVGKDIEIEFSGLRPGEKLYEEMFAPNEAYEPTQHEKILVAHNASQCIPPDATNAIDQLIQAALNHDIDGVMRRLQLLLPEYQPWREPLPRPQDSYNAEETPKLAPRLTMQPALAG